MFGWPSLPRCRRPREAREAAEAATDQMHAVDLDVLTDDERADLRDLAKAARAHQG